jgi:hypothetical protein
MIAQTAEDVAARIADVIRNPVAELYTNPASPELARRYYADVAGFEQNVPRSQPVSPPIMTQRAADSGN